MLLTAGQLVEAPPANAWFCLKSPPKREHIAAAGLRQIPGVEVICPRIRFKKKTARGAIWFVEALFPGYLFARFPFETKQREVRHTAGVSTLVHFGDKYALLEDEALKAFLGSGEPDEITQIDQTIERGDQVNVIEGPFRGLQAIVHQLLPGRERVRLLLEFLGRTVETEAGVGHILPVKSPRVSMKG